MRRVAHIVRQHGVAERERRRAEKEVGEWNHDSAALLRRKPRATNLSSDRSRAYDRASSQVMVPLAVAMSRSTNPLGLMF
jgi:hypothetical protein